MHDSTLRDRTHVAGAPVGATRRPLSHPSGWWRDTAQRLLVERGSSTVTNQLKALATGTAARRTRVKALWVLDGNDSIDVPTILRALADPSRDVRTSAVRIAERWLADANSPVQAALLKLIDDPDWSVREQLAASLGALPAGPEGDRARRLAAEARERSRDDGRGVERHAGS